MRLYASPKETQVLIDALCLLKVHTVDESTSEICSSLIQRVVTCNELQHPCKATIVVLRKNNN